MAQLSLFKGRRQRGVKPPPPKEFSVHVMVADILRHWAASGWRWTHFPSGELRHWTTANRLKRMGTQPGWPDFILLAPGRGAHFLEMKRQGEQLSDVQLAFADYCNNSGYPHAVVFSFNEALAVLQHWRAVRINIRL